MKIVVGSRNPVKIQAVEEVFKSVFGDVEVAGVEVESGVKDQPVGDEETINGARNRAKLSVGSGEDVEYGVGLEGGVFDMDGKMFECAWCCVRSRDGEEGLGGGLRFEIPEKFARDIRRGVELGDVLDKYLKRVNVKQSEGAIGVLTKKHVTRKTAYKEIVYYALVRFVSGEWYE